MESQTIELAIKTDGSICFFHPEWEDNYALLELIASETPISINDVLQWLFSNSFPIESVSSFGLVGDWKSTTQNATPMQLSGNNSINPRIVNYRKFRNNFTRQNIETLDQLKTLFE